MNELLKLISDNSSYIILGLSGVSVLLLIVVIYQSISI